MTEKSMWQQKTEGYSTVDMYDVATQPPTEDVSTMTTAQIVYIVIGTIGILSNTFTIVVILSYPSMRKKLCNMLIINQSLVDFGGSLFLLASANVAVDKVGLYGISGYLYCIFWITKFPMWACFVGSSCNLVFITLERYFEVVHPFKHRVYFTKSRVILVLSLPWMLGLLYQSCFVLPTTKIESGRCIQFDFPSQIHMRVGLLSSVLFQFYIPLAIMIFCYARIIQTLRKVNIAPAVTNSNQLSSAEVSRQQRMINTRKNVMKTMILVNCCFFLCWVSGETLTALMALGLVKNMISLGVVYDLMVFLVFINCCINPFVYAFKYQQFQNGVKRLFCKRFTTQQQSETQNTTT